MTKPKGWKDDLLRYAFCVCASPECGSNWPIPSSGSPHSFSDQRWREYLGVRCEYRASSGHKLLLTDKGRELLKREDPEKLKWYELEIEHKYKESLDHFAYCANKDCKSHPTLSECREDSEQWDVYIDWLGKECDFFHNYIQDGHHLLLTDAGREALRAYKPEALKHYETVVEGKIPVAETKPDPFSQFPSKRNSFSYCENPECDRYWGATVYLQAWPNVLTNLGVCCANTAAGPGHREILSDHGRARLAKENPDKLAWYEKTVEGKEAPAVAEPTKFLEGEALLTRWKTLSDKTKRGTDICVCDHPDCNENWGGQHEIGHLCATCNGKNPPRWGTLRRPAGAMDTVFLTGEALMVRWREAAAERKANGLDGDNTSVCNHPDCSGHVLNASFAGEACGRCRSIPRVPPGILCKPDGATLKPPVPKVPVKFREGPEFCKYWQQMPHTMHSLACNHPDCTFGKEGESDEGKPCPRCVDHKRPTPGTLHNPVKTETLAQLIQRRCVDDNRLTSICGTPGCGWSGSAGICVGCGKSNFVTAKRYKDVVAGKYDRLKYQDGVYTKCTHCDNKNSNAEGVGHSNEKCSVPGCPGRLHITDLGFMVLGAIPEKLPVPVPTPVTAKDPKDLTDAEADELYRLWKVKCCGAGHANTLAFCAAPGCTSYYGDRLIPESMPDVCKCGQSRSNPGHVWVFTAKGRAAMAAHKIQAEKDGAKKLQDSRTPQEVEDDKFIEAKAKKYGSHLLGVPSAICATPDCRVRYGLLDEEFFNRPNWAPCPTHGKDPGIRWILNAKGRAWAKENGKVWPIPEVAAPVATTTPVDVVDPLYGIMSMDPKPAETSKPLKSAEEAEARFLSLKHYPALSICEHPGCMAFSGGADDINTPCHLGRTHGLLRPPEFFKKVAELPSSPEVKTPAAVKTRVEADQLAAQWPGTLVICETPGCPAHCDDMEWHEKQCHMSEKHGKFQTLDYFKETEVAVEKTKKTTAEARKLVQYLRSMDTTPLGLCEDADCDGWCPYPSQLGKDCYRGTGKLLPLSAWPDLEQVPNETTDDKTIEAKVETNMATDNKTTLSDVATQARKDAEDAAYRIAANQLVKLVSEPLAAAIAKGAGPDSRYQKDIAAFLETELGRAMIRGTLAAGLAFAPGIPGISAEMQARMAREMRVSGAAGAGDFVADIVTEPMRMALVGLINTGGFPAIGTPETKVRVSDTGLPEKKPDNIMEVDFTSAETSNVRTKKGAQ